MSLLFNFHTSTIFSSDVEFIPSPNWFNDALIAFAMEYLQYNSFKARKDVKFVSPGTAFVIMHEDDQHELSETLKGAQLLEKRLLFFPVNNNPFVTEVGGSHWSLLVFDAQAGMFYSLDSAGTMNYDSTVKLVNKLAPFLLPKKFGGKDDSKHEKKKSKSSQASTEQLNSIKSVLTLVNVPQQHNAYDCGVFSVAFAEFIAMRSGNGEALWNSDFRAHLDESVNDDSVTQLRSRIGVWIEEVIRTSNSSKR